MSKYAADTSVPVERSRGEIERILARYGASRFAYATEPTKAMIGFECHGRTVRFILPLPDPELEEFQFTIVKYQYTTNKKKRSPEKAHASWEQACRSRWRSLALAIKAKLECVECGIASFEEEFLAHIVLPSGATIGDSLIHKLEDIYKSGKLPKLLEM